MSESEDVKDTSMAQSDPSLSYDIAVQSSETNPADEEGLDSFDDETEEENSVLNTKPII